MQIYLITSNPSISDQLSGDLKEIGTLNIVNAQKLSPQEVIELATNAEVIIAGSSGIEQFSAEIFKSLKKLKFLATLTVNTAWIDMDAAQEAGVIVANIKGANAESVAEHTWGMILDLAKRITEFDRDVRTKGAYEFANYTGKEVFEKTIGIIGFGDIGSRVARIARAFDMRILAYNRSPKSAAGVEFVDIEEIFSQADVIVTSIPLTAETRHIISHKELNQMKNGVIIVNPAMEEVTDNLAIVAAIESGKVFGFGIETDIMKPIEQHNILLSNPRIIVTPHNAFNTEDANKKSYQMAVKNVKAFLEGHPINLVTS